MKYPGNYIYPPRPSEKISREKIKLYDTGDYLGQPKYNGDAVVLKLNEGEIQIFNRHKEPYTKAKEDVRGLLHLMPDYNGSYVFAGEYLSKNKLGEDGQPFNHKLIIWDVLVWQGNWLVGSTFQERADLIESIFPAMPRMEIMPDGKLFSMQHILRTPEENIFRAPVYSGGFTELYDELIRTDLYEGLVLKRADAKLKPGWNEINNTDWQVKVRKETNNYHF